MPNQGCQHRCHRHGQGQEGSLSQAQLLSEIVNGVHGHCGWLQLGMAVARVSCDWVWEQGWWCWDGSMKSLISKKNTDTLMNDVP